MLYEYYVGIGNFTMAQKSVDQYRALLGAGTVVDLYQASLDLAAGNFSSGSTLAARVMEQWPDNLTVYLWMFNSFVEARRFDGALLVAQAIYGKFGRTFSAGGFSGQPLPYEEFGQYPPFLEWSDAVAAATAARG